MKRRDLADALRKLGWRFLRHGGKHDVWTDGERQEAIPRHSEINDRLAERFYAASAEESKHALSRKTT